LSLQNYHNLFILWEISLNFDWRL